VQTLETYTPMSARRYKNGWWCDFRFDGKRYRRKSPVNTKRGAERYERALLGRLRAGLPIEGEQSEPDESATPAAYSDTQSKKEVSPTFAAFAAEFMNTYAKANNKLSEQEAKQCHLRKHLLPAFGAMQLHEIDQRQIEAFKARLLDGTCSRKRVNNLLATLGRILSYATELEIIARRPKIRLLKVEDSQVKFLDFAPYEALIAATQGEPVWHAAVLLGGDAGLRLGEIRALRWEHRSDDRIVVQRSLWRDHETTTKGWKRRTIPLTDRLRRALDALDGRGHTYVVSTKPEAPLTLETTRWHLPRLCRKADIEPIGWHALRHSFCSHLAMMGVPARTIQELAGHADLTTTLKYMHLVEGEKDRAISLLNDRKARLEKDPEETPGDTPGEIVEENSEPNSDLNGNPPSDSPLKSPEED